MKGKKYIYFSPDDELLTWLEKRRAIKYNGEKMKLPMSQVVVAELRLVMRRDR